MAKAPFHKKKTFHQQIWLKFKEETNEVLHLDHSFVCRWKLDTSVSRSEILKRSQMWCWRRMEISWTDRVRNEVLRGVKEESSILHTVIRRKANWIGHILRRNCLLEHVIVGKIEGRVGVTGRRRRRRSLELLGGLKEKRGYWKLKVQALDCTIRRTGLGRGCGPVVRLRSEWMNVLCY
jgi:hypothetical protein